jgi:hypothetical protein
VFLAGAPQMRLHERRGVHEMLAKGAPCPGLQTSEESLDGGGAAAACPG